MNNTRNLIVWVVVGLLLLSLFNFFKESPTSSNAREINFSQFVAEVEAGNVEEVVISGDSITGKLADGRRFSSYAPPNDPTLINRLTERGVSITAKPDTSNAPTIWGILLSWFPMLLLIGVWVFFMRQMQSGGGKAMGFGKSKAKLLNEAHGRVTFEDVAGIDEAKDDLQEIVEFLKDPGKFQKLGGRIPKGALLVGPPGTGKRYWPGLWLVKRMYHFSLFQVLILLKCLSASVQAASGICLNKLNQMRHVLSS